jgi:hypothetical protein
MSQRPVTMTNLLNLTHTTFYGVGGTKAGGSMLTGFGGETCRAMKQVTFNTVRPIAIVKRNGFMSAAARFSQGASRTSKVSAR